MASQAEAVIIEFDTAVCGEDVLRRLNEQLPAMIRLHQVRRLEMRERLIPEQVRYRVGPVFDDSSRSGRKSILSLRIRELMSAETLEVERTDGGATRRRMIDVRPYIVNIEIHDDAVEFTLRVSPAGSARPVEILTLLGLDAEAVGHRIERLAVQWVSHSS